MNCLSLLRVGRSRVPYNVFLWFVRINGAAFELYRGIRFDIIKKYCLHKKKRFLCLFMVSPESELTMKAPRLFNQ